MSCRAGLSSRIANAFGTPLARSDVRGQSGVSAIGITDMRRIPALLFALYAAAGSAQELSIFGGAMQNGGSTEQSYAWALDYRHGLGENAALTFSWLNEGHARDHHRDGQSLQLWGRANVLERRLSLAAGAGPYRYYDTTRDAAGAGFSNAHGWGVVYSLAATYYTDSRFLYELRANRIVARDSFDTTSFVFGIGYQLDPPHSRGPLTDTAPRGRKTTENELTVFLGQTIVNSFQSERDAARALEYRRGLSRHIDWTVSWLNEGDPRLVRRDGLVTQLWAVREAFGGRLAIGVGLGPYLTVDRHHEPTTEQARDVRVSAIFTASAAVRLGSRGFIRGSWNRVLTDYDRDTDIVLIGLGYRF